MALRHGSLFSGIGGIDLGFSWANIETVWQVERDEFCRKVLQKHWPDVPKFVDVRDCGRHNLEQVDIISGGFPCQPFSPAGKRQGTADDRYVWPEMLRIICELHPAWVLAENVPVLRADGADRVLSDLEEAGYASWSSVVGAWSAGAPHYRDRAWILAHAHSHDATGARVVEEPIPFPKERKVAEAKQEWDRWRDELGATGGVPGSGAYRRIVRTANGISGRVDRLRTLGSAVVPQIPAIIGRFIVQQSFLSRPRLSDYVFNITKLNTVQKVVLWALAHQADESGRCSISYNEIANHACCSRRSAIGTIQALEGLGLVARMEGQLGSNTYRIDAKSLRKMASASA